MAQNPEKSQGPQDPKNQGTPEIPGVGEIIGEVNLGGQTFQIYNEAPSTLSNFLRSHNSELGRIIKDATGQGITHPSRRVDIKRFESFMSKDAGNAVKDISN